MDNNLFDRLRARLAILFAGALPFSRAVRDVLRASPLLVTGLVTLWLVATPNPIVANTNAVKVGMLAWLLCKESLLAYLGYWVDRRLHPHARPSQLKDIERMASEKRRAFIVCAAMIAGGLYQ